MPRFYDKDHAQKYFIMFVDVAAECVYRVYMYEVSLILGYAPPPLLDCGVRCRLQEFWCESDGLDKFLAIIWAQALFV